MEMEGKRKRAKRDGEGRLEESKKTRRVMEREAGREGKEEGRTNWGTERTKKRDEGK